MTARWTAGRTAEVMFIAVGPALAFWLMHFTPVAPPGFLDPFVYTGYINNFDDLFQRYGLTYYSVRFGLLAPSQLMVTLFGPFYGYFALRYVYALLAGVPFYLLVRQRFGQPTAIATFFLLLTSPYVARAVLWDHPDASGVPFLFAAMALFLIEHRRRFVLDAGAGLLAGMAVHSNVFVAVPVGIFLACYSVLWLFWRGGLAVIAGRLLVFILGIVVTTVLGAAYYWWRYAIPDIFSITIEVSLGLIDGGMATWRTPGIDWVGRLWGVLTPVFLCAIALLTSSGRRLAFHESVIWVTAVGTTAFFYAIQFLLDGNSLELFYYFSYLIPLVFLLLAVIVGSLWSDIHGRRRWIGALLLLSAAVGPWVMYSLQIRLPYPTRLTQHLAVVLVAIVTVVLWRLTPRYRATATLCASAALGLMFFTSFWTTIYIDMVGNRLVPAQRELDVYRVALQLIEKVPRLSVRPGTVGFWYSNEPPNNPIQSVQSTYLWGYSKVQGESRGLPYMEGPEIQRLRKMQLKWLVLLAEKEGELTLGHEVLRRFAVNHTVVERHVLDSDTYRLHYELLELPQ